MAGILRVTDRHGPQRITAGKRVLGVMPITVHCYRIGTTLIDAGPPNRAQAVLDQLGGDRIETVVLTHHHEDHVGLAGPLSRQGAQVLAPEGTLGWLADGIQVPFYRWLTWGRPEPVDDPRPLGAKVQTPDVTLEVVPTPGHSPEHVALFAPEHGWLFAGDAYLGQRLELRAKEDLDEIIASLERMRELDADLMLPGHGPAIQDVDDVLAETLALYEDLRARAWQLAEEGRSKRSIRRELLGREPFLRYFSQGDFKRAHLVDELLEHPPPSPETS